MQPKTWGDDDSPEAAGKSQRHAVQQTMQTTAAIAVKKETSPVQTAAGQTRAVIRKVKAACAAVSAIPEALARAWCQFHHPDPMWPVNGEYQCRKCHRKYPVPF